MWDLTKPVVAGKSITAMIEGSSQQQDFLCRVFGRCLHGPIIDSEVGSLIDSDASPAPPGGKRFTYVRYNTDFRSPELADTLIRYGGDVPMDLPHLIPAFQEVGRRYAANEVRAEHLR